METGALAHDGFHFPITISIVHSAGCTGPSHDATLAIETQKVISRYTLWLSPSMPWFPR